MTDEELMKRLRHRGTYNEVFDNAVWDSTDDRIEQLTAERDRAYASGYSDAETEINKSALGQDNTFLHSQYTNAILRIEALTAERDEAWAYMSAAQGDLYDAIMIEAERDRLREALTNVMGYVDTPISRRRLGIDPNACEWLLPARAALKGESHE